MNLIDAFNFALLVHEGQKDKAGEPYIGHVVRVMLRLPSDASELERKAALLHDVLEDGGPAVYEKLVQAGAEPELMGMISYLSRRQGEDYADFIDRVGGSPAIRVKMADIEDNSDLARLAKLPKPLAVRLREKYLLAWAALAVRGLQNAGA